MLKASLNQTFKRTLLDILVSNEYDPYCFTIVSNKQFTGSSPIPSLERLNVELLYLTETPKLLQKAPFLLVAPIKIFIQVISILCTLLIRIPHPPEYIMVQVRELFKRISLFKLAKL